jgi:hypothetical protein
MPNRPEQLSIPSLKSASPKREYKPFVPGPNPELPEFIRRHATPYDPKTDRYDVPAFDRDIVVDKAHPPKAIYDMHTYWSKKHWAAIRQYIQHYLPGKFYPKGTGLVLDCFSGSGMTGVAAMMENRPCVLIDASPAAAFISHCYTHPVDPDEIQEAYKRMMTDPYPSELQKKLKKITGEEIKDLQQELEWLYATRCDRCGGPAMTEYVVYSERFQCPGCAEVVALYDCPEIKALKKARYCPHCLTKNSGEPHKDFSISTRRQKFGSLPVAVVYRCLGRCKPAVDRRSHQDEQRSRKGRFFREYDQTKLASIDGAELPHWYPNREFIRGYRYRRDALWIYGIDKVADLYTKRNLWALSAFVHAMKQWHLSEALYLGLIGMSLGVSRMNRYVPGHWSVQNRIMAGTYYIPQLSTQVNIGPQFAKKVAVVTSSQGYLREMLSGAVSTTNQDASSTPLQAGSVDFVFTDPAYVDKVQYGELNFVWESWLGFATDWLQHEIIVNPTRGKSLDDWDADLRKAIGNCFRALKPGRWLSLCYHDTDPGTWSRLQDILLDTGFEIHTVTVLDPKQKSSNQITGEKVVKGLPHNNIYTAAHN